jgi:hypothetical protein
VRETAPADFNCGDLTERPPQTVNVTPTLHVPNGLLIYSNPLKAVKCILVALESIIFALLLASALSVRFSYVKSASFGLRTITNLLVALLRSEIRPQGKLQASSFVFRLSAPAPCFPALLLADTLHGFPERPVVSPQVFLRASRPGRPGFPSGTSQSNIDRWQTP